MARRFQDVAHRADLGEASGVHDHDAVGDLGDDAHVVRDQHHRGAVTAADLLHQRDDLRLHRDVERGRRLVGDEKLGIGRQRQRQHHALAHAARELVRIGVHPLRRRRDANLGQELDGTAAGIGLRHVRVRADRLGELSADAEDGIEARQRVLEHHADAPAADGAHAGEGQGVDALAGEPHLAAGNASGRLDQPDDGGAGHRLAGPGFADHAQHLARRYVEREVVDGDEARPPRRELDAQIADAEDGCGHAGGTSGRRRGVLYSNWRCRCHSSRSPRFPLAADRGRTPVARRTCLTRGAEGETTRNPAAAIGSPPTFTSPLLAPTSGL